MTHQLITESFFFTELFNIFFVHFLLINFTPSRSHYVCCSFLFSFFSRSNFLCYFIIPYFLLILIIFLFSYFDFFDTVHLNCREWLQIQPWFFFTFSSTLKNIIFFGKRKTLIWLQKFLFGLATFDEFLLQNIMANMDKICERKRERERRVTFLLEIFF